MCCAKTIEGDYFMKNIKIHVFHTGEVCVAPDLPFGGDDSNGLKHQEFLENGKIDYGFRYQHI